MNKVDFIDRLDRIIFYANVIKRDVDGDLPMPAATRAISLESEAKVLHKELDKWLLEEQRKNRMV